jgi:hypothetical protein
MYKHQIMRIICIFFLPKKNGKTDSSVVNAVIHIFVKAKKQVPGDVRNANLKNLLLPTQFFTDVICLFMKPFNWHQQFAANPIHQAMSSAAISTDVR